MGEPVQAGSIERILDAAEACFRRDGFEGTSVRDVSQQAGVSKSLVLYHFQSKERLYVEVQRRIYERLARAVKQAAAARGGTAEERGLLGLDALLSVVRETDDVATHTLLSARALSDPSLRRHVDRLRADMHRLLRETMVELCGPALPLPMSEEAAADVLQAAVAGLSMLALYTESKERVDRAFAGFRALIALALRHGRG